MDSKLLFWFFFSLSGRVSRLAYLLAGLFLAVIQMFLLYRFTLAPEGTGAHETWAMLFWIVVVVSLWCNFALSYKRVQDFDRPGIIAAAVFVPVLAIVAFIALCIIPGTPGPNQHGERTNAPR